MRRIWLVGVGLLTAPGMCWACGGANGSGTAEARADAMPDPSGCARKTELLGGNCSYTTGMVAERVLTEGTPWSFVGHLVASDNMLPSHVAAPYTVGPDEDVHVVANEVLEDLIAESTTAERMSLEGMRLEVNGIIYFVITRVGAAET